MTLQQLIEATYQHIANLMTLIVPALGAFALGWLRDRTLKSKAREAALRIEEEGYTDDMLRGEVKMQRAVDRMEETVPKYMLRPNRDKLRHLVHESLPHVQEEVKSRRSSDDDEPPKQ